MNVTSHFTKDLRIFVLRFIVRSYKPRFVHNLGLHCTTSFLELELFFSWKVEERVPNVEVLRERERERERPSYCRWCGTASVQVFRR